MVGHFLPNQPDILLTTKWIYDVRRDTINPYAHEFNLVSLSDSTFGEVLYTYRSLYSQDNQQDNEWTDKFNEALVQLDEIKNGDMYLYDTAGSLIEERSTTTEERVESNTEDYHPTFDEGSTLNQLVDTDKISDIADAK